jgi:hypothetical protein
VDTVARRGVILGYPRDQQVWLKAGDKIASSVENWAS